MATIQRSNTKVANKLVNYAEKRAEVREGVNCPAEYAKSQMKATRELWGKSGGIQAHHIIQSFKPGELSAEQANEIGQELAKEVAKGHEAVVYTHTDKDHIHNHIVINSVNYEDGSKYHASKESLYQIREANDRLCKERGLSVVQEKTAAVRYTQAEKSLVEQGKYSWKDEIRDKIDQEKQNSTSYDKFKENLSNNHNIEVKERGSNTTYINHENGKRVRGTRLGEAYEKETIKHEFEKFKAREGEQHGQDRGNTDLSNEQSGQSNESRGSERTERVAEANERFERPHEGLHQNEHGQKFRSKDDVRPRDRQHQDHKQTGHDRNAFDINEARKALERESRDTAKGFNRFTTKDKSKRGPGTSPDEQHQRPDRGTPNANQSHDQDRAGEHEQEERKELGRTISKDIGIDR